MGWTQEAQQDFRFDPGARACLHQACSLFGVRSYLQLLKNQGVQYLGQKLVSLDVSVSLLTDVLERR